MMGKGSEGGYAIKESYIYLPNTKMSPESASLICQRERRARHGQLRSGMDVYAQVLKSLAVKPAFGFDEAGPTSLYNPSAGHPYLRFLNPTENKQKHRPKPTQIPGGTNRKYTPYSGNRDPCGSQFWAQVEDYFREVTTEDIQLLLPQTTLNLRSEVIDPCFLIPAVGPFHRDSWSEEIAKEHINASKVVAKPSIIRVKRKLLGAVPVSKKNRISSATPVTVISPPENDDDELCHVCHSGDCDEHNQILFCDSCNVAVHQECYGVTVVPEGQWLCSWCFHRLFTSSRSTTKTTLYQSPSGENDFPPHVLLPDCVLCPVKGGAVKPVAEVDSSSGNGKLQIMKFAHLFCCQWVPETYIHDMQTMEPIKNVEGVRKERWRLLCSVCRDKYGACIQCSHGMCATAFHPLCARDAMLRMEVSSKECSNDIELRAFCSKHSACNGRSTASGSIQVLNGGGMTEVESSVCVSGDASQGSDASSLSKEKRTKFKDGSNLAITSQGGNHEPAEFCKGIINEEKLLDMEVSEDMTLGPICTAGKSLAKLLNGRDRMGLSPEGSVTESSGGQENWGHLSSGAGSGMDDTNKICKFRETKRHVNKGHNHIGLALADHVNAAGTRLPQRGGHLPNSSSVALGIDNKIAVLQPKNTLQFRPAEVSPCILSHQEAPSTIEVRQNTSPERDKTLCGNEAPQSFVHPYILKRLQEAQEGQATDQALYVKFKQSSQEEAELKEPVLSYLPNQLSHACVLSKDQQEGSRCKPSQETESICGPDYYFGSLKERISNRMDAQWKQLQEARSSGVLNMVPIYELEEELFGLQNSLIVCAQANHHSCEQLLLKVITSLPDELRAFREKQQDWMLMLHYLNEAQEARKQGRKERRNKEAQAVLAAAAAAVAASPRLGGTRRDSLGALFVEDRPFSVREISPSRPLAGRIPTSVATAYSLANTGLPSDTSISSTPYPGKPPMAKHLKVNIAAGRPSSSRTAFRAKGTVSKPIDGRHSLMKSYSDHLMDSKEESTLCDICGGQDVSATNTIVHCQHCKVAVHQECYGVSRHPVGAWYCQPCCEVSHECQGLASLESENGGKFGLSSVQCALCCKQSGAFKRSSDGQWVHVFCALWMPELKVGKDQTASIEGLEAVLPERFSSLCGVCRQQQGSCLRCNFGHCHAAFHPLCAREAGFYMNVKPNPGSRAQYRAYCEKHSPQQRAKAETVKCGPDELNALKQIRVELERVRLICERISKRERLKRDLLNCTRDLYNCRLAALSASLHVSDAQSATVASSLTIDTGHKSYHQEMPWVDNLPKDSLVGRGQTSDSEAHHYRGGDIEFSTCQHSMHGNFDYQSQFTSQLCDPSRPVPGNLQTGPNLTSVYSTGKQINEMGDTCPTEEGQKRLKIRKAEPLHREVVMTPTEASVQNQRLPKGYAYVPVVLLSKGKVAPPESTQDL